MRAWWLTNKGAEQDIEQMGEGMGEAEGDSFRLSLLVPLPCTPAALTAAARGGQPFTRDGIYLLHKQVRGAQGCCYRGVQGGGGKLAGGWLRRAPRRAQGGGGRRFMPVAAHPPTHPPAIAQGHYALGSTTPLALLWKDAQCSTYLLVGAGGGSALLAACACGWMTRAPCVCHATSWPPPVHQLATIVASAARRTGLS
jgi:hypothetical protein